MPLVARRIHIGVPVESGEPPAERVVDEGEELFLRTTACAVARALAALAGCPGQVRGENADVRGHLLRAPHLAVNEIGEAWSLLFEERRRKAELVVVQVLEGRLLRPVGDANGFDPNAHRVPCAGPLLDPLVETQCLRGEELRLLRLVESVDSPKSGQYSRQVPPQRPARLVLPRHVGVLAELLRLRHRVAP